MENIKISEMNNQHLHGLIGVFATAIFGFISLQTAQVWAFIGTGLAGLGTFVYYGLKAIEMIKGWNKKSTRKRA